VLGLAHLSLLGLVLLPQDGDLQGQLSGITKDRFKRNEGQFSGFKKGSFQVYEHLLKLENMHALVGGAVRLTSYTDRRSSGKSSNHRTTTTIAYIPRKHDA
jgi:hypothetical protein